MNVVITVPICFIQSEWASIFPLKFPWYCSSRGNNCSLKGVRVNHTRTGSPVRARKRSHNGLGGPRRQNENQFWLAHKFVHRKSCLAAYGTICEMWRSGSFANHSESPVVLFFSSNLPVYLFPHQQWYQMEPEGNLIFWSLMRERGVPSSRKKTGSQPKGPAPVWRRIGLVGLPVPGGGRSAASLWGRWGDESCEWSRDHMNPLTKLTELLRIWTPPPDLEK